MLSAADTSRSWDSRQPKAERFNLPVVYLNRNGQAAVEADRVLSVSISGIAGGAPARLETVSWHENRATWEHERQVKRFELEEMACRPVANIPDTLDEVMDAALARQGGPQPGVLRWSFEESVVAFARANYALRLENGRCAAENVGDREGRYDDPHGMYASPIPEAVLSYDGSSLEVAGSIPSSFGTDLIEISLDGKVDGQPFEVVVSSGGAPLEVQVWRLSTAGDEMRALAPQPERLADDCRAGCRYAFSGEDLAQAGRLAVIVVRLDPNEETDDAGAYLVWVVA